MLRDIRIEQVGPDRWTTWRDLRLRALRGDPDAFGSTYDREAGFDEATWRSRVDGTTGPALLAYAADQPVGMGAGRCDEPGWLMVVAMWTEPSWRGRGIGRQILAHVTGWAGTRGLRCHLWVADGNPAARALYERYGFRSDGETMRLREDSELTAHHLVLAAG
ncbi:GNAT family N-acetyltransferase [Micromonospora sp. HM5-17]|jgi:GNAT superfamily N-acetyltransferase|uniref:GNAT family N-acetyltransferase n=1 Tax=Micromonospora sp. HM5-17 TaxID=2487710 RepID=UPI000F4A11BC|nr:GNAT family N-acetyltransferase [Micromonospora sp. HM5-17]ROT27995.1 N-acetyltransferase [Micromonospora sp. HM5-17]